MTSSALRTAENQSHPDHIDHPDHIAPPPLSTIASKFILPTCSLRLPHVIAVSHPLHILVRRCTSAKWATHRGPTHDRASEPHRAFFDCNGARRDHLPSGDVSRYVANWLITRLPATTFPHGPVSFAMQAMLRSWRVAERIFMLPLHWKKVQNLQPHKPAATQT
jgi:hypothetical protein